MLGIVSVLGLVAFIATFALIMMRSPDTPVRRSLSDAEMQRLVGPQGERGPTGPAGPAGARGPAGEAAIRIVRAECVANTCTAECAEDEMLLSAYCSPTRSPVTYPTEHSALCRAQSSRVKVEVVAACLKTARR